MRVCILLLVLMCAAVCGVSSMVAPPSGKVGGDTTGLNLWPQPQSATYGTTSVQLSVNFTFQATKSFDDLTNAFKRYTYQIFRHTPRQSSTPKVTLPSLTVTVDNPTAPLEQGVDESYQLTIPVDGSSGILHAATYYGALHGLESFGQLTNFNFSSEVYIIAQGPWSISDSPRFSYRGLLVDTARHFEPLASLKKIIKSLTFAKLNVLHWHISDSQSFPFQSLTYPLLWNGAYSPVERYTQNDVKEIIEYAREHGIRVMIEFDIPGHAESWCVGYPNVCPSPTCTSPLDPSSSTTFSLMQSLFTEVAAIFPEQLFHLGGDEVDTSCWSETPRIVAWMNSMNFTTDDTYMYMVEKGHQYVSAANHVPVNWEEVFNHFGTKLDPATVVHIWLNQAVLSQVVAAGYRGILSNQDVWYLDHLDTTWQQFYENEPWQGITDPKQQSLVLGGEVCMWGETVDESDLFNTVWPRAAAAAERLWSPLASLSTTSKALPRLEWFRCYLNAQGIPAAPTNNQEARQAPPSPGGCFVQ